MSGPWLFALAGGYIVWKAAGGFGGGRDGRLVWETAGFQTTCLNIRVRSALPLGYKVEYLDMPPRMR